MAPPTNNIAFTAPINPPGATPVLNRTQVWKMLELKARSEQTFAPKTIQSTNVISDIIDPQSGGPYIIRDIKFSTDQRTVRETCMLFEDCRILFTQADGSQSSNIVSVGADGQLYLTYVFEMRHPGVSGEELEAYKDIEMRAAKVAVEDSITAMRELVK